MAAKVVFQLGSGLGLLILGMKTIKNSFYQLVGEKLEFIINLLTVNLPAGIITGLLVTILLQSSSAAIVIVISLIETGMLSFRRALGVIMGANLGTTVTVHLFSFSLENSAGLIILIGLIVYSGYYLTDLTWLQYIARGIIGFGVLFFGLDLLSSLVSGWRKVNFFRAMISNLSAVPLWGIIAGSLITAVIQSSSALTGIVVVLAKENLLGLLGAISLALGSNIGTCITAFIVSWGAKSAAKKAAWFHLVFNLTGALVLLPVLPQFAELVKFTANKLARQVANAHTMVNFLTTVLFVSLSWGFNQFLRGGKKWN